MAAKCSAFVRFGTVAHVMIDVASTADPTRSSRPVDTQQRCAAHSQVICDEHARTVAAPKLQPSYHMRRCASRGSIQLGLADQSRLLCQQRTCSTLQCRQTRQREMQTRVFLHQRSLVARLLLLSLKVPLASSSSPLCVLPMSCSSLMSMLFGVWFSYLFEFVR